MNYGIHDTVLQLLIVDTILGERYSNVTVPALKLIALSLHPWCGKLNSGEGLNTEDLNNRSFYFLYKAEMRANFYLTLLL